MNNGHFAYFLDDAYIHLAVAKHLAQNGVFGITKYSFSSSVSSILWPLLEGLVMKIVGVNDLIPLYLNIVFGNLLLLVSFIILKRHKLSNKWLFISLCIILYCLPLPLLIFQGMEHVLQILIDIVFIYSFHLVVMLKSSKAEKGLLILAPLVTMIRYEGLALVFSIAILLFLYKKYKLGLSIIILSIIPLIIFGIISIHYGWHFIPNSLLVKGGTGLMNAFGLLFTPKKLIISSLCFLSICIAYILDRRNKGFILYFSHFRDIIIILIPLVLIAFLEGFNFRYESALIYLLIIIGTIFINERTFIKFSNKPSRLLLVLLLVMMLILIFGLGYRLGYRTYASIDKYLYASNNIYTQQYQMANFLKNYYNGSVVALNDIGIVNYELDIHLIDLAGLGSLNKTYVHSKMDSLQEMRDLILNNNTDLIIIYDSWFKQNIPKEWFKVAIWNTTNHNVTLGDDKVSFYAIDYNKALLLQNNLKEFESFLPPQIRVQYYNF